MKREAFIMKLKDGCISEYRQRHDQIWPELVRKHAEYGICNYSIFYDEQTQVLFAFRQLTENACVERIGEEKLIQKWWEYNADLMECYPDHAPVCHPLEEVFHMD